MRSNFLLVGLGLVSLATPLGLAIYLDNDWFLWAYSLLFVPLIYAAYDDECDRLRRIELMKRLEEDDDAGMCGNCSCKRKQ